MDTTSAIITANRVTPVSNAGKLLALADVSILMDGVEIVIHAQYEVNWKKHAGHSEAYNGRDGECSRISSTIRKR